MDDKGKTYFEGMSGLWCVALGWGNEELIEAASSQMRTLAYYHGFTNRRVPVVDELADALVARAPSRLQHGRVFFGQSGSDANDTQVRLLWAYNHARGLPHKTKLLSRNRGYHGVTVAAGSLTGLPYVHTAMGLPLQPVCAHHVTCPSFYREGLPNESEADFVQRLAQELDDAITREGGAERVAAFIAEPIQGAGGVVVPPAGYFHAVRDVCDKHDVMMIADEVITGFGRTGNFWGCTSVGQDPDLISCAKQLTGGYVPLSACIVPEHFYQTIRSANRADGRILGHGYTYSGHPVACAVALKVIEIIERDGLVSRVHDRLGPHMQSRVKRLGAHALVGETRGMGLIGAIELVADKQTKRHFAPSVGVAAAVARAALDLGLVIRPLPGDALAFCPPLTVDETEIDEMFDKVEMALDRAMQIVPATHG